MLNGPRLVAEGRREEAGLTSSMVMEMVGVPLPVLGGIREWRRWASTGLSSTDLLLSSCNTRSTSYSSDQNVKKIRSTKRENNKELNHLDHSAIVNTIRSFWGTR